jgi:Zn-finger nucleic acid-binding protein
MTETAYGEMSLDECGGCGGTWFDRGEMEQAVGRLGLERTGEEVPRKAVRHVIGERPGPYLECPRCASMMGRTNFEKVSGVLVDRCSSCGIWLDRGEMDKIFEFVSSGGRELARKVQEERAKEDESRRKQGNLKPPAPDLVPEMEGLEVGAWFLWEIMF